MSRARRIRPGRLWLITRRCIFRHFLLRPDKRLNQILGYCLAYAAGRTGMALHLFYFGSNHFHFVLTDPDARLPEFMQLFDGLVARAVNCLRGRWDRFWEGDSYGAVELETDEAVWEKLIYCVTNPVKDGLVSAVHHWPGLVSKPSDIRRWLRFDKPSVFFRREGLPERVALRLEVPELNELLEEEAYKAELARRVATFEQDHRDESRKLGRRCLGRRAVLRQSPYDSPRSEAPRRRLNPRLATGDTGMMAGARRQLAAFYAAYAEARKQFEQGTRDVLFPEGTYLLRVRYGVCCAGPSG